MWVIESKGNIGGYRQVELSLGCCADMIVEKKKKISKCKFHSDEDSESKFKTKKIIDKVCR